MRGLLARYERLRGVEPSQEGEEFWDLVVISAGDPSQQSWYEAQLELKHQSGDLPLVPYHIIPDPPGPRIGSGGSTLHILAQLSRQFGARLDNWRILLIHAGGFSKRLPSHSCSGKIFSPLPVMTGRGGPYQMLDLKLALYLPFLAVMQPGVFVTASDDIEVFNLDTERLEGGRGETITALAHPSSLYIGTTHGVYVMKDLQLSQESLQDVQPCLEVLQKPSVDLMRERGAVVRLAGDDMEQEEEIVFSDSAFWFHSATSRKLLGLSRDLGKLEVEMCIYGDLLTCLGEREDKDYLTRLYQEEDHTRRGVEVKRKIAETVGDTDLAILTLHQSKFYHLGTTQEYLHGLTNDRFLRLELNLENIVCSQIREDPSNLIQGIVLNSVIEQAASIPSDSIVEYSAIRSQISLGAKTILSNVEVKEKQDIPEGFLYHTVAILLEGCRKFVTVAFHVTDDMKFSTEVARSDNLQYGGKLLEKLFSLSPQLYTKQSVFSSAVSASLWTARLFSAQSSMAQSFRETVRMVASLCNQVGNK